MDRFLNNIIDIMVFNVCYPVLIAVFIFVSYPRHVYALGSCSLLLVSVSRCLWWSLSVCVCALSFTLNIKVIIHWYWFWTGNARKIAISVMSVPRGYQLRFNSFLSWIITAYKIVLCTFYFLTDCKTSHFFVVKVEFMKRIYQWACQLTWINYTFSI